MANAKKTGFMEKDDEGKVKKYNVKWFIPETKNETKKNDNDDSLFESLDA